METLRSWLEARDPAGPVCDADVHCFSARDAEAGWFKGLANGRRAAVRVSPVWEPSLEPELDALLPRAPWAVMLPRCRSGADVQQLGAKLAVREARLGLDVGSTHIVAVVGSAATVLNLASLSGATSRLVALVADPQALGADLGAAQPTNAIALMRTLTVLTAAAAGIAAIDGPRLGPFGVEAVRAEAQRSRDEGFRGRIATRPEEVAIYDEAFASPF